MTSDTLSAEQIVDLLGIVPDRLWNIGDFRPDTRARIKEANNGITIESGITKNDDIDQHLVAIVTRLTPFFPQLASLPKECETRLVIVFYSEDEYDYNPEVWFDSSFTKFLASINAGLWVDLYDLREKTEMKHEHS